MTECMVDQVKRLCPIVHVEEPLILLAPVDQVSQQVECAPETAGAGTAACTGRSSFS